MELLKELTHGSSTAAPQLNHKGDAGDDDADDD